jgi:hypothetical protein
VRAFLANVLKDLRVGKFNVLISEKGTNPEIMTGDNDWNLIICRFTPILQCTHGESGVVMLTAIFAGGGMSSAGLPVTKLVAAGAECQALRPGVFWLVV